MFKVGDFVFCVDAFSYNASNALVVSIGDTTATILVEYTFKLQEVSLDDIFEDCCNTKKQEFLSSLNHDYDETKKRLGILETAINIVSNIY